MKVEDDAEPVEVERAEIEMLEQALAWLGQIKNPPVDSLYAIDYLNSMQLEAPYGWVSINCEARFV